jgi:hypothetical protein
MKNTLKSFGLGLLFAVMSYIAYAFGTLTIGSFKALPTAQGWEAIGLFVAGILIGFMALFIILCLGGIPLSIIEDLKEKLKEKEESEND